MKKRDKILQLQYDDNLILNLSSHFFASDDNVYIFDESTLLGVIKYDDFVSINGTIQNLIKEVPICKESHECFNHDLFVVFNGKSIVYEYSKETDNPMSIKNRFKALYDDNDKIITYLRSLNITKVYIFGSLKEKLFNHLEMYGNDFKIVYGNSIEDFYEAIESNSYIIDTDSEITGFKEKLARSYQLINGSKEIKMVSLEKLCELSEYYYFVNNITKNPKINVSVLEFPDIFSLENLTDEEKFRIAFDHLYRYYYARYKTNPYIDSILKKVFGELYSDEFIKSRDYMPKVLLKGGRCFLENSDNPYCGSRNGERITTDQIHDYNFNVNFFGPCLIFGPLSDDSRTICSYLQRLINENDLDYRVHNFGARAVGLLENIRSFDGVNLYKNDQCIFVVHPDEKKILEQMGFYDFIDLKPVFEDPALRDYFIDEPVHCNHVANEKIAQYTFNKIKNSLLVRDPKNEELAEPISVKKKKEVFKDNAYLKDYLEFLDSIKVTTDNNGCILMNCNPFTYGHYRLIEHASKLVPTLYVFIVQENKSYFEFVERFEMVKEGCKGFSNVVVIPSGKIFASAMLFPEYFNKEDNSDVEIDVSLDRELFTEYIAPTLNITKRFVGEENVDLVTRSYNRDLKKNLPLYGIEVYEIPRFREGDKEISAKVVRKALEEEDWETIKKLVPETTIKVLKKRKGK